ncbi:MAG: hypothetical protein DMG07_03435 [Acidobacteria bacterium]|nr:MAG: hypothetical protein DMG07_03435 [Acidobacteriota bacterium]
MSVIRQELFRSLPQYEPSFRALAASVTAHILAAAILVLLPLVFIEQAPEQALAIVHLVAPGVLPPAIVLPPAMMSPPRQEVVHLELPRTEPEPPEPKEIAPREVRVEPKAPLEPPPIVAIPAPPVPAAPPVPLEPPRPAVKLDAFPITPAPAEPPRPARIVQTGGFGAPLDAARDHPRYAATELPVTGAFDLPRGSGRGPDPAARVERSAVVSAGFESAAATGGSSERAAARTRQAEVRPGGFGDARPGAQARSARQDAPPPQVPVEILAKPKPAYTKEARDLRLEGEVLLEVLFGADGEARVLRMIQGLGHGLDESAARAAEQIRFKPAERDGRPVDSSARVSIVFRLA